MAGSVDSLTALKDAFEPGNVLNGFIDRALSQAERYSERNADRFKVVSVHEQAVSYSLFRQSAEPQGRLSERVS